MTTMTMSLEDVISCRRVGFGFTGELFSGGRCCVLREIRYSSTPGGDGLAGAFRAIAHMNGSVGSPHRIVRFFDSRTSDGRTALHVATVLRGSDADYDMGADRLMCGTTTVAVDHMLTGLSDAQYTHMAALRLRDEVSGVYGYALDRWDWRKVDGGLAIAYLLAKAPSPRGIDVHYWFGLTPGDIIDEAMSGVTHDPYRRLGEPAERPKRATPPLPASHGVPGRRHAANRKKHKARPRRPRHAA